jgi:uncharacterized membrane protein
MKDVMHLRMAALASNVAFLVYGLGFGLVPVWILHAILLPVNVCRLWQEVAGRSAAPRMHHHEAEEAYRRLSTTSSSRV